MEVRDFDDLTHALDKLVQEKDAKIAELEKELSEAMAEIERLNNELDEWHDASLKGRL